MQKILFLILFLASTGIGKCNATTWNEPWADQVIKKASSFILAKVISYDGKKGIRIQIYKTISGKELKDTIQITDFSLLDLCSSSGDGVEFHVSEVDSCYFFISRNKEGKYCIATPTTGFDYVSNGQVSATFRHSYHKALVPVPVYEKAMTAVFNNYHNLPYEKDFINEFVVENLSKQPAGYAKDEINLFFLQHVALECVHHLKLDIKQQLVLTFFKFKNNFHSQVSAARALAAHNTASTKRELLEIISDTSQRVFVQVICVWTLAEFHPKELKSQLEKLEKDASEEEDGFGGNIMDPRVCTSIPTVKSALKSLVSKL